MEQKISRERLIDSLSKELERLKGLEGQWIEEEKAKGNDPDKDIAVRCVRLLRTPFMGWLIAEKELVEMENRLGKTGQTKKQLKGAKPRVTHEPKESKVGYDRRLGEDDKEVRRNRAAVDRGKARKGSKSR